MNVLGRWLFNPTGLTPHGYCLLWQPGLLWLHALSDGAIGLSYFSIPLVLSVIVRRRPDLVFRPVVALFAAFILVCGAGHWLNLVTLWVPVYGLEGAVKALAAVISAITAVALWRLMPQAVRLPSPMQMRKAKADLHSVQQAEARMAVIAAETAQVRDALADELRRREATEAALRESEGRFRLLLQSSLAEALYLMDPDGTIETWNAGAERIKGYTPDEVIGRNYAMFFTRDDVIAGAPQRALAIARETGHFAAEGWRVRKDGVHFLARVAIDAIYRDDGTLRGFVKVTIDLTKQRIDEAQRRMIVAAAPNGLMTVDEARIITLANSAADRIFGFWDGGLVGQAIDAILPDLLLAPGHTAQAPHDITSGATLDQQLTGRKCDGTPVTIELKLSTVRTPLGNIMVLSLADVTERLRQEAERQEAERRERQAIEQANANLDRLARHLAKARDRAERANRAKTHFLAGMSHELRTPLNAILGYAHLLKMDGGFTPTQNARLGSVLSASRHLLEMITCVLDMSEIEADHVTLRPSVVDVRAICEACLDLVRPAAEAKSLALGLDVEPGTSCILVVDPTRLRQILVNLLGNAVKFTPQGGVDVRLQNSDDRAALRIEVRDTGPGIPADSHAHLFQDFERLGAANDVEGAGLGLGLSFRLTRLLGGKLTYEDNRGGGSVFWMELPFGQVAAEGAPAASPDIDSQCTPVNDSHVLVVDDVQMNLEITEGYLRSAGYLVTTVDSGRQAVAAVADGDFDVVLMDVRMPDMDGLEATRRIRSLEGACAQVPIIGLTANAFNDQVAECRTAGMDGHLAKPFEPETLLATVNRTLGAVRRQAKPHTALVSSETGEALAAQHQPQMSPDGPWFDVSMFERTCSVLAPEVFRAYLRKIESMCVALKIDLRGRSDAKLCDRDLAVAAHTLSGSAGMFGFLGLARLGRQFERGVLSRAETLPELAGQLIQELDSVESEIRSRIE